MVEWIFKTFWVYCNQILRSTLKPGVDGNRVKGFFQAIQHIAILPSSLLDPSLSIRSYHIVSCYILYVKRRWLYFSKIT